MLSSVAGDVIPPGDDAASDAVSHNLRLTELHFNPADPTPAELAIDGSLDNDDFEYMEFQNVGSVPMNTDGMRINNRQFFLICPQQPSCPVNSRWLCGIRPPLRSATEADCQSLRKTV